MSTTRAPRTTAVATVALIGNPNTGKTTLFNALTGLSQQVGNFPGVTVERKVGRMQLEGDRRVDLLDLPGTYSLAAHSPDEMIAVDVLLGQQAGTAQIDAVLAIVDASNLRRNLYLVSQLLETGRPVAVALNMVDVAKSRGIQIDARNLSDRLGVPVVPVCAHRRQGIEELRRVAAVLLDATAEPAQLDETSRPQFPESISDQVAALSTWSIPSENGTVRPLSSMEALRALIDEGEYAELRLIDALGDAFATELSAMRNRIREEADDAPLSALESTVRYAWIDRIVAACMRLPDQLRDSRSDRVDRFLTHRLVGSAVFLLINALIFQAIYAWSGPMMDGIDSIFVLLGDWLGRALPEGPLRSLLIDGVITGVGGVLIFLPQIAILFLFVSVLEDCGYMSRAAMLMDRLLTFCGLSGKSFIPLLSSFACAVPGIMAARTIEDRRDRITTILVAPLMSCSARLPIYILFIAAFVPDRPLLGNWLNLQGLTLLAMYSLGIFLAVPIAWLLKKFLLRGATPPFLLELPSYKWPNPHTVLMRVYQNSRAFVVRAGSIILAATIVMWALAYFPHSAETRQRYEAERQQIAATYPASERDAELVAIDHLEAATLLEESYLGRAGHMLEPIVRPLGWDWRIGMATLASFPAREVIISALGTIYSLGGDQDEESEDMRSTLRNATSSDGTRSFNLPVALSVMVFFALCAQCMSTLVTIQRETGSWGWAALTFGYLTLLAYGGAFVTYQATSGLGWGG